MKELTQKDWLKEWQKNPIPREMWVWDNDIRNKEKRKVLYIFDRCSYPVLALERYENGCESYKHCAEIEKEEKEPRRMTKQELAWWLRKNFTREYKHKYQISIYYEYVYTEDNANDPVEDILVRECGGEWVEPLISLLFD